MAAWQEGAWLPGAWAAGSWEGMGASAQPEGGGSLKPALRSPLRDALTDALPADGEEE